MGESREASIARHHAEGVRTRAMNMFVGEKKTVGEISRVLNVPVSTVSAWVQHIPKKHKRGRKSTEVKPVAQTLSREQLLDRYFATFDRRYLRAAVTATTITDDAFESDDEDDE